MATAASFAVPCDATISSDPPSSPPRSGARASSDAKPKDGEGIAQAPTFALQDLRGTIVESRYASRPVTVVHFWASWCVPCMREIPELNRFASEWEPKGAAFYAVALQSGSAAEVRQLVRPYGIRHTVLMGDEALARKFGRIPSFPTTFIVDRTGKIVETHSGATPEIQRKIESTVRAILGAER